MAAPYTSADATVSARRAVVITPSDTADLSDPTRAVYIGNTGNLKVDMVSGGTVTFKNLPSGMVLPIQAIKVYATGTSATELIGLY